MTQQTDGVSTQLELAKAKLPVETFNHLKWYLDQEIEGMESYVETDKNYSYPDELHERLLIGLSNWIAILISQAKEEERKRVVQEIIDNNGFVAVGSKDGREVEYELVKEYL